MLLRQEQTELDSEKNENNRAYNRENPPDMKVRGRL